MDNVAVWSIGRNQLVGSRECSVKFDDSKDLFFTDMGGKTVFLWESHDYMELNLEETGIEFVWFVD